MPTPADITVHSPEGKLELVVGIKGVANTDAAWAAQYRQNLLSHQYISPSPYFLLFAPDSVYLWSPDNGNGAEVPTTQGSTKAILSRYLPKRDTTLSPTGLEMAVQSWLQDLALPQNAKHLDGDEKRLLIDSGLLDKIRTGSLTLEPAP